ncbi:MAG: NAD(P)H-dependent oxidoreductase [Chitinophagales bacterium]|nr:NAD(P)H-dependent oxidoreductase [Chitinophagales bacterium]
MKILAFGASSNSNSINQKLALYAASQFTNASIETIDLNEFEMPLYSLDKEKTIGIPTAAKIFIDKIKEAEFIIISLAEHNGSYSVVFKNLFDWASRVNIKTFMVLMLLGLLPENEAESLYLKPHYQDFLTMMEKS